MLQPDPSAIATFLAQVSFFREVTEESLEQLSEKAEMQRFGKRDVIIEKGAPGDSMFAILSGRVSVHDGSHKFGELERGECFGEYALIDREPRSASITALEDTQLIKIPYQAFMDLMYTAPGFSRGILAVLIKRHRRLDEVLQRLARTKSEIETAHGQISSLIEGAMDAIVLFDRNYRIRLTNPAACGLFQNRDVIGRNLLFFLNEEGGELLESEVLECQASAGAANRKFLSKPIMVIGSEEGKTLAEGTISMFNEDGDPMFTLILRNIEDRIQYEQTIQLLTKQTDYLEEQIRELTHDHGIIAESPQMGQVMSMIEQVAGTEATVLILGETGTGKELVARAIHRASPRAELPMIRVNCGAIPANLIESELFGHEKGAFTGATSARKGRFMLADGGSIFLDEIGELPVDLQPKLLRVIQEGEFDPVGSSETVRVDVRIIAATHRDLKKAVSRGTFREDLYYRLNVFPIRIPPLRDRDGDILLIAREMIRIQAERMGRPSIPLSKKDEGLFLDYDWPGNVRELQNLVERGMIIARNGKVDWKSLLLPASDPSEAAQPDRPLRVLTQQELEELERTNILRALEQSNGKISGPGGAAGLIGIPPSTFTSKMKALGIYKAFKSREKS